MGRYRRLVATVLRDLREEKGGATGRSVDWQLTGEHRRVSAQQRNGGDCVWASSPGYGFDGFL